MDPPPYACGYLQKRREDFYFREGFINFDQHGTPVYPREVFDAKTTCQAEFEKFPQEFHRRNHHQLLLDTRSIVAADLSCSPDDLIVMRSTNDALFCTLHEIVAPFSFCICLTGSESNAALRYLKKNNAFLCHIINYLELSVDEMRTYIRRSVPSRIIMEGTYPAVIVDLVPANPVQNLALHTIIQELRNGNMECRFLIHDANGMGLTNFRLAKDFPTIYITSGKSWFYSGSPCAFVYRLHARKIFLGYPLGERYFEAPEHLDYPNLCAIKAAKQYINAMGGLAAVQAYQNTLAANAHSYLLTEWKLSPDVTKTGKTDKTKMQLPSPIFFVKCPFQPEPKQQTGFITFMKDRLREKHQILVAFVVLREVVQIRFSAAIYLDLRDFEVVRTAVDESIGHWKDTPQSLGSEHTNNNMHSFLGMY